MYDSFNNVDHIPHDGEANDVQLKQETDGIIGGMIGASWIATWTLMLLNQMIGASATHIKIPVGDIDDGAPKGEKKWNIQVLYNIKRE